MHVRMQVNLIMDTMGALALGTEPPTDELLERKPYKRSASLIDRKMWRAIASQSVFQLALLLGLLYGGLGFLNADFAWLERTNHLMFTCPDSVPKPCTWRSVVRYERGGRGGGHIARGTAGVLELEHDVCDASRRCLPSGDASFVPVDVHLQCLRVLPDF